MPRSRPCAARAGASGARRTGSRGRGPARPHGLGQRSPCRSRRARPQCRRSIRPRPDDRFACLEQPDRDGFALATLGQAVVIEARGPRAASPRWPRGRASLGARRHRRSRRRPDRPPAAGPGVRGRLRLRPRRRLAPEWGALRPGLPRAPGGPLSRQGGEARMTSPPSSSRTTTPARSSSGCCNGLRSSPAAMPLLDPDPVERTRVASARRRRTTSRPWSARWSGSAPASSRRSCCARGARARAPPTTTPRPCSARCGSCSLPATAGASARRTPRSWAPAPSCSCGATASAPRPWRSPGTTRRSADPSVDDHLGEELLQSAKNREEQAIVARRIERTLEPVSLWVAAGEPVLVKVHNVQHLATPIRAQLADPVPTVELAGLLLPTPAVGGEPREAALPLIPALEGLDRGWYAGRGRLDRPRRGRRVLRRAPLRAPARAGGPPVRGLRHRARLRAGRGAGRDRGQAPGAAAAPVTQRLAV